MGTSSEATWELIVSSSTDTDSDSCSSGNCKVSAWLECLKLSLIGHEIVLLSKLLVSDDPAFDLRVFSRYFTLFSFSAPRGNLIRFSVPLFSSSV